MLRVSKIGTSVRTVVIWFAGQPSTKENKLHALNRDEHSTIMWTHLCASTRCPQFMTEFLSDSDDTTQNCMLSWRSYHLSSETTLSKMAHNFAASFEWSKKVAPCDGRSWKQVKKCLGSRHISWSARKYEGKCAVPVLAILLTIEQNTLLHNYLIGHPLVLTEPPRLCWWQESSARKSTSHLTISSSIASSVPFFHSETLNYCQICHHEKTVSSWR